MPFVSSSKRMPVGSGNLSSIASPFGLSKAMNVIRALNPSEDMQIRAFKRFTFILQQALKYKYEIPRTLSLQ